MSEQTNFRITPLTSRLLAVTILLIAVAVVWALIVSPVLDEIAADRQRLSFAQARLSRYAQLAHALPSIRAKLAQIRSDGAPKEGFFQGDNQTLLSAELQQAVQKIVGAAGADIGSSQTVAVRHADNFFRLGLQLTLTTSADHLYRVLYELENASPVIIIDRLTVTVPENGISYSNLPDGQPGLSVELDLAAYASPSHLGHSP
jgi:hypothetical protein